MKIQMKGSILNTQKGYKSLPLDCPMTMVLENILKTLWNQVSLIM